MKKSFISMLSMLALSINLAFADDLTFDPAVKTGTLDNGLKYYILKNKQTKNNAYFYLNVQAGSIDETDEEQGLAHFVEHMAFNGSTHFKKNELIHQLEKLGVRFGADLNAMTSFQDTTYNLQINTAEKENIDSAFLVLSDWAGGVSFDVEEVEKEKGVVLEEAKKDVNRRFYEKRATYLYPNSIFAKRFPIGKNEIIANTDQKTVKGFYQRMYRPDIMSVVVVGDIDEKEIEQKIKNYFSSLKNSGSLKRSDESLQAFQKGVVNLVEKEGGSQFIQVLFAEPYQAVRTDDDIRQNIVEQYISSLLHLGFQKLNQELKSPQEVFFNEQNLFNQRTLNAFAIDVVDNNAEQALQKIFSTIKGVKKYGFSQDDFASVKKELLQANHTDSLREETQERELSALLSYIKSGTVKQSKKDKHALIDKYLNEITLDEVNQRFKQITKGDYFVEIISQSPIELTQKQVNKINKKSKAYNFSQDFQAASSLLDKIPAKQAIKSESILPNDNIHKIAFANGATVYLKDIKTIKNKINFTAVKKGGLTNLPDVQQAKIVNAMLNAGNIGKFEKYEAQKITKGYSYGLSASINNISTAISGQSSAEDFEKMLQELFVRFQQPTISKLELEIYQKEMKSDIAKRNQTVEYQFGREFSETFYHKNKRALPLETEDIEKADWQNLQNIAHQLFANAGDYSFIIAGDLDIPKVKELVQVYIANLPHTDKKDTVQDDQMRSISGKKELIRNYGDSDKSEVTLIYRNNELKNYSVENVYAFNAMKNILQEELMEKIREEDSKIYSIYVGGSLTKLPFAKASMEIYFSCKPEDVNDVLKNIDKIINDIQKQGVKKDRLANYKKASILTAKRNAQKSEFWVGTLNNYLISEMPIYNEQDYEKRIENISDKNVQNALSQVMVGNRFVAVLNPQKKEVK